jgi:hypothetical protein
MRHGVGRGHGVAWDRSGYGTAALDKAMARSLALEKGAALSFLERD